MTIWSSSDFTCINRNLKTAKLAFLVLLFLQHSLLYPKLFLNPLPPSLSFFFFTHSIFSVCSLSLHILIVFLLFFLLLFFFYFSPLPSMSPSSKSQSFRISFPSPPFSLFYSNVPSLLFFLPVFMFSHLT